MQQHFYDFLQEIIARLHVSFAIFAAKCCSDCLVVKSQDINRAQKISASLNQLENSMDLCVIHAVDVINNDNELFVGLFDQFLKPLFELLDVGSRQVS